MQKCSTTLLLVLLFAIGSAQSIQVPDSSTLNIAGKNLNQKAETIKDYYKTTLGNTIKKYVPLVDSSQRVVSLNVSISAEGEYISNSNLPENMNGFYYRTGINGGLKIGQLPFNAGVTLNYRNNRVWADYTLMSFTFDSKGFLSGLKTSYLDYLSDMGSFYTKELTEKVMSYQDSMNRLNDLQGTLTDQKYYDKLRQFNFAYKNIQDSIAKQTADSCTYEEYERVSDSINQYKNMAKEFASLEKYKSSNTDLQQYLNKYNNYVDSVKGMKNILSESGIKSELSKAGLLSKPAMSFSGIQKLGIGRVNLQLSEFTARSQSIYGFNVDYLFKGILYAGVGLGIASPNNFQFNPSLSNLNQPIKMNFSRFLGYLRLGIGTPEENHLHLIYLSYGDKFNSTTNLQNTFAPAPANAVLSLEYKKKFKEFVTIEGEFATSNSSYTNRAATFSPIETGTKKLQLNFALRTAISSKIKKTATSATVKANAISTAFRSAGNLFQRHDFAEYSIALNQPLFNNKLSLNVLFNHNFSGIFSGINSMSYINMNSVVTATPFAFVHLILNHNFIKQISSSGINGLSSQMINLTQQYVYGKEKVRGTTGITFGYTESKSENSEAPVQNRMYQAGLTQTIILPKSVTINLTGGTSTSQVNGMVQKPSFWIETGNSFNIKSRCSINYNFRYLRDYMGYSNYFTQAGISATLYKGLQLRITEQLQIQTGLHRMINTQTMAGLNYAFSYTFKKPISLKSKKPKNTLHLDAN